MNEPTCTDPFCAEHSPLMKATVRFWNCPVQEHRDRRGVVTVEWREGIAHCTQPGCDRTSAAPLTGGSTPFADNGTTPSAPQGQV